jgi:NAD(P)H-dependent flavin oxidoreductase YrpB (nitropropane dioxygenase family)
MSFNRALETSMCKQRSFKYAVLQAGIGFVAHGGLAAVIAGAGVADKSGRDR